MADNHHNSIRTDRGVDNKEEVNDMSEDKTSVLPFFRWHRGGMKESLDTAIHVKNMGDLKTVLSQSMLMTEDTSINVQYYGYDDRLALHTYVVLVNGYITGFICNDKYEWQEESIVKSVSSKAEAIAQAAKDVYTELRYKFDEDTAKELLIASMPTITEDVVKPTAIRFSDGGLADGELVLWGDTEPEFIVPKETGWLKRSLDDALKTARKKMNRMV